MSIASLLKSAFNTTDLYSILSLPETASDNDIKKAYHKMALKCHPDKCPSNATDQDKQDRTTMFQGLSACYDILSTESKRKSYDRTGRIPCDDDMDMGEDFDWGDYFAAVFKRVDVEDILKAHNSYRLSDEERGDVIKYYRMCKGDGKKMLECVMCSEHGDFKRWKNNIITPAIEAGDVDDFGFKNFDVSADDSDDDDDGNYDELGDVDEMEEDGDEEDGDEMSDEENNKPKAKPAKKSPAKKNKLSTKKRRDAEAKEAEKMLAELTGAANDNLTAMILGKKSKKEQDANSFLASLEAKYAKKPKAKKAANKKKAFVDPLDDAEFERIRAGLKKK